MCGIGGIRVLGEKPITERQIRLMLIGLEHRGNDATGIAFQFDNGDMKMLKASHQAWNFVTQDHYKEWVTEMLEKLPHTVILHTRAATKGNPHILKNNHPLYLDNAMVVHNGSIYNDDELFHRWKLDRGADTDSDIIRAAVDKWGVTPETINKLDDMRGTAAIAAMNPKYPGKLLVGRSGSPLTYGINDDYFVFASEKNVIHKAMRPWVEKGGIVAQRQTLDMGFSTFPDNTLWILGPQGLEFHGAMRVCMGTYKEPCRKVYQNWRGRHEVWKREAETDRLTEQTKELRHGKVVEMQPISAPPAKVVMPDTPKVNKLNINCPHCNKALVLRPEQQNMDLADLSCPKEHGGCGRSLREEKVN